MPSREQVLVKEKRVQRIEKLLLQGVTNQSQIASALGCTQPSISRYVKEIQDRWKNQASEDTAHLKAQRIRQLETVMGMAFKSFEISQQNKIETTTKTETCGDCIDGEIKRIGKGTKECPRCQGTGKIVSESQKQVGQAGDAKYLSLIKDLIVELSKLEGHYPSNGKITALTKERFEGEIGERLEEFSIELPMEDLITAKSLVSKLKNQIKQEQDEAKYIENEADNEQAE